jgi:NAD-dependent dihydropyrimidine dehydrogenase PreA subunit
MKSKLISIDGKLIGIIGVDEIFTELFQAGEKPSKELENRLLEKFKEHNYIPKVKEESYAQALLEEYEEFCNRKSRGVEEKAKSWGTWQGVPREEVPWFPTIMEELCDGCKLCLNFCSFGVYEYEEKSNKVKVANPFNCQVGCSICALKCKPKAISFPPLAILESFRKRQNKRCC